MSGRSGGLMVWVLLALLAVSSAFGAVKTAKMLVHFFAEKEYQGHSAPGVEWETFKGFLEAGSGKTGFVSRRIDVKGKRPSIEFYYDAQYALAPHLLIRTNTIGSNGAFYLIDDPAQTDWREAASTQGWELIHHEPGRALIRTVKK